MCFDIIYLLLGSHHHTCSCTQVFEQCHLRMKPAALAAAVSARYLDTEALYRHRLIRQTLTRPLGLIASCESTGSKNSRWAEAAQSSARVPFIIDANEVYSSQANQRLETPGRRQVDTASSILLQVIWQCAHKPVLRLLRPRWSMPVA